ncbi:MAG TPA: VOC family protein [Gemmatimonadaceae bacterium]|nr:VOC family protein [Gemmatimonadaceae bacterium]
MRRIALVPLVALSVASAQQPQFLAVSVRDLDASTRWYTTVFGINDARDLPRVDSTVRTRMLSSPDVVIELSAHSRSRSLRDIAGAATPSYLVHGFFKAGVFVPNLDSTVTALRARQIQPSGTIQADNATGMRWAILRDPDGNYVQLLARRG